MKGNPYLQKFLVSIHPFFLDLGFVLFGDPPVNQASALNDANTNVSGSGTETFALITNLLIGCEKRQVQKHGNL